ncbi:MAG: hypoxanthine phosphoribosyltransferase [Planctomycetes bacterium]|nr:hypoxanthine phosphoribosyltransferase [Planctomycetota bacterium]
MENDVSKVLLTEAEIRAGLKRLAGELTVEYRGSDLAVVAVLHGSCVFVSDLIRLLPIPLTLEFLACGSYGEGTVSSGEVRLTFIPGAENFAGRRVLLVDDILDTGRTLLRVREALRARGAADVKTCVFLDKPSRRVVPIRSDFRGFEIEDVFVVGYGLDFAGRYRNLPYLAALKPEIYAARQPAPEPRG